MSSRSTAPRPSSKSTSPTTGAKKPKSGPRKPEAVPYHRKPEGLDHEAWQRELRRQYAPEASFEIRRLESAHPFFGDYSVHNPASGRSYKVAFRDGGEDGKGLNWCECLDFRTNLLGTCKHVESVLRLVSRRWGAKKAIR